MPAVYLLGWTGILAFLAILAISRTSSRPSSTLTPQLAVCFAVLALGAGALVSAGGDEGPSLETWQLHIGAGETPVTVGTDPGCDVVLQDPSGAPFHALVRFDDDGPHIQSLTADRRLEINGVDAHHPELAEGDRLVLDGEIWTVERVGVVLPGMVLRSPADQRYRLSPRLLRRLAGALPLIGPRYEATVGWIDDTEGQIQRKRPEQATGALAQITMRGRTPLLKFPTPADRHEHRIRLDRGDGPHRPADRPAPIRAGDVLTIGYTRYTATIDVDGSLDLEVPASPPRTPFDPEDGVLVVGPGGDLPWSTGAPVFLQLRRGESGNVSLISTDPDWTLDDRQGYLWLHPSGGSPARRVALPLVRGSGLIISGDRHESVFRFRMPSTSFALLGGEAPGTPEAKLAWGVATAALAYVLLTFGLVRLGYLHGANAAVLHGPAVLVAVGLPLLVELSSPGNPRHALMAARQAVFVAVGLGVVLVGVLAAWLARTRFGVRANPWLFLERPIGAAFGARMAGGVSRIWLLWLLAAGLLAMQLPFGEQGIPLPWIGSLQPVEAAKTLLMVFVAFLSVRALEDKQLRLPGREGLIQRWNYMIHGLPLLLIAALCFGLDDISPILLLGLFLWSMYHLTLVRPERKFWPPRALAENVYVEQAVLFGLAGAGVWASVAIGDGTVSERFHTWIDPWTHTATSGQYIFSLWTVLDGGLLGRGFGAPLPPLPPAAHDDFVLAVLANRLGLVGLLLTWGTYTLIVLVGMRAVAGVTSASRPELSGRGVIDRARMLATAALLMLAIQVVVVLASVTGWAPVMGQPLPFMAAGGSHMLLFCLPAIAMVMLATRYRPPAINEEAGR